MTRKKISRAAREQIIRAVRAAARNEHVIACVLASHKTVSADAREALALWGQHLIDGMARGVPVDLFLAQPQPAFITSSTDPGHPSAIQYRIAMGAIKELGRRGQVVGPQDAGPFATGLQVVYDNHSIQARVNGAVRGVLRLEISPLDNAGRTKVGVGWWLNEQERHRFSHVTLIHGTVDEVPGVLVFADIFPTVTQRGSDEQIRKAFRAVASRVGATGKLRRLEKLVDASELRSELWNAWSEGYPKPYARAIDALMKAHEAPPPALEQEPETETSTRVDPSGIYSVHKALENLSPQDSEVMQMLADGVRQREIAAQLGLSQQRISQIKKRVRASLHRYLTGDS